MSHPVTQSIRRVLRRDQQFHCVVGRHALIAAAAVVDGPGIKKHTRLKRVVAGEPQVSQVLHLKVSWEPRGTASTAFSSPLSCHGLHRVGAEGA